MKRGRIPDKRTETSRAATRALYSGSKALERARRDELGPPLKFARPVKKKTKRTGPERDLNYTWRETWRLPNGRFMKTPSKLT
jgi:hypothetical protein